MTIFVRNLLLTGVAEYTLTVVTTPSDATCVLTANGIQYTTKSLKVKKGTVVSYSVSYSGTTTKTGSVTMDSDKTLTFTRTYSTSTTYQSWTQPTLSSTTGNGTLGGDSFAVYASKHYSSYYFWKAFDGNTSTEYWNVGYGTVPATDFTLYNPVPIKISTIVATTLRSIETLGGGTVYGSNDGNNWTTIRTYTNTVSKTCTINVNSTTVYTYYKIANTSTVGGGSISINEIVITATKPVTSYTYYFDLVIS